MQTENECGDGKNTWAYALYVFSLMQHYINNGVVAYVYWNMVLPPGGVSTWGWPQNAMITADPEGGRITHNPEFYVMKHCANFVKPGAVVCGLRGPWQAMSVAFRNPDGRHVLVTANPCARPESVTIVHGSRRCAIELPARSLNTLVF